MIEFIQKKSAGQIRQTIHTIDCLNKISYNILSFGQGRNSDETKDLFCFVCLLFVGFSGQRTFTSCLKWQNRHD